MEIALLQDIVIISGLALAVVFVCHRLRIPDIVGFLVTGILSGPYGLGLVSQVHEVEKLAEIGVVCLLFTIGLEFSLKSLLRIKFIVMVHWESQTIEGARNPFLRASMECMRN